MDRDTRQNPHDETPEQALQVAKYNQSISGDQTGEIRRFLDGLRAKLRTIIEDLNGEKADVYELAFKHKIAVPFFQPALIKEGYFHTRIKGIWQLKTEIKQERKIESLKAQVKEAESENIALMSKIRELESKLMGTDL